MERIPTPQKASDDEKTLYEHLFDNSQGIPIILTSNPSSSDLIENQVAFVTGTLRLYRKLNGTLYYHTLTAA